MKIFSPVIGCLLAACMVMPALAQSETSVKPDSVKPRVAKQKNKVVLSEERIEELFAFVDEHHPELRELLSTLEKKKKRQYQQALTGLNRSVKKLEQIKERSPKRYEFALKQWKLDSRIKVTSAQLKLKDTEEGRARLESLITQLVDFHINRMKSDREQVFGRLEQLDKKISEAESGRQQAIEKRLKAATRVGKKKKKTD